MTQCLQNVEMTVERCYGYRCLSYTVLRARVGSMLPKNFSTHWRLDEALKCYAGDSALASNERIGSDVICLSTPHGVSVIDI